MPSKARVLSQSKASAYIAYRQIRSTKLHNLRQRLRLAGQKLPVLGQVNHELRLLKMRETALIRAVRLDVPTGELL